MIKAIKKLFNQTLKLEDFKKMVIDKKIKVDFKGHNSVTIGDPMNYFVKEIDRMAQIHVTEIKIGKPFPVSFNCWDCDCYFKGVLLEDGTVSFLTDIAHWNLIEKHNDNFNYKVKKEDCAPFSCKLDKKDVEGGCITTNIAVPTGKLIVVNCFKNDVINQLQGEEKYAKPTINSLLGRIKLARYLEKLNVGYGQMGNMGMYVHANKTGNRIVFNGKEKYRDYKCYGHISLSVWRWQCADVDTLKKYDEKIDANCKPSTMYHDQVQLRVKPGTWQIKHYLDLDDSRYTVLTLKK